MGNCRFSIAIIRYHFSASYFHRVIRFIRVIPPTWQGLRCRDYGIRFPRTRSWCYAKRDGNMSAVVSKFGPSRKAFLIVPIVGAFLIDVFGVPIIITTINLFK